MRIASLVILALIATISAVNIKMEEEIYIMEDSNAQDFVQE
jgi:hypothetical protein